MKLETGFFKGPVTSCEYFKENYILLGKYQPNFRGFKVKLFPNLR